MEVTVSRWLLIASMLFACLIGGAGAADARTGQPIATCFRPVTPGAAAADLLRTPAGFNCSDSQRNLPPGDYWVRSEPLPHALPANVSVRSGSLWQKRLTLYVLRSNGTITRTGFSSRDASAYLRLGAVFDLPLSNDAASRPVRLLWRIEGATGLHGLVGDPRLLSADQGRHDDAAMLTLNATFAGLALALLLYTAAMMSALRQPFQPAYYTMLLSLLLYSGSSSGFLEQVFGIDDTLRLRLNALALAATIIAAIAFARDVFGRAVFNGWLRHLSAIAIAVVAITTAGFVLFAPWRIAALERSTTLGYLVVLVLVPMVLVRAWRTGAPHLRLFAVAWGAPILLGMIRLAAALHLVDRTWWVDNSTVPAMTLEACLYGFVLAARIRLVSRERDEARVQEVAARLLADTDPLTGLLNRRAFLSRAIGRAGDQALMIVDIDHFKQVNETIGHDGGDEVLRIFARTLRDWAGLDVLIARIGGEEFAAVFDASAVPDTLDLLDRLRAARMPYDLTVTASIGACLGPLAREPDWKRLYQAADRALFQAKAAGRDRSRVAEPLAA